MGRRLSNPAPASTLAGFFFMAKQKFWMVYRLTGSSQAKSRIPRFKHPNLEAAEAEANRLASANPGVPFAILEAVGAAYVAPPPKEKVTAEV